MSGALPVARLLPREGGFPGEWGDGRRVSGELGETSLGKAGHAAASVWPSLASRSGRTGEGYARELRDVTGEGSADESRFAGEAMRYRMRKSTKVASEARLNVSKSSAGMSAGAKGVRDAAHMA